MKGKQYCWDNVLFCTMDNVPTYCFQKNENRFSIRINYVLEVPLCNSRLAQSIKK